MQTRIIEVVSEAGNHGKMMLCRFDAEWEVQSLVTPGIAVLDWTGWTPEHLLIVDLATGEGAIFRHGGYAHADLEKHRVWVCPLFEPMLTELYKLDVSDLDKLPGIITLGQVPLQLQGYRRTGPERDGRLALEILSKIVMSGEYMGHVDIEQGVFDLRVELTEAEQGLLRRMQPLSEHDAAQPHTQCPQCGRRSWHPEDIIHGYCNACHEYTSEPVPS